MRQYMAHTWPRAQNEFFVPCAIFSGRRYTCPACTTCCRADTQNLRSLRRSPQIADAGALSQNKALFDRPHSIAYCLIQGALFVRQGKVVDDDGLEACKADD